MTASMTIPTTRAENCQGGLRRMSANWHMKITKTMTTATVDFDFLSKG